jgi:hypothetical protein
MNLLLSDEHFVQFKENDVIVNSSAFETNKQSVPIIVFPMRNLSNNDL